MPKYTDSQLKIAGKLKVVPTKPCENVMLSWRAVTSDRQIFLAPNASRTPVCAKDCKFFLMDPKDFEHLDGLQSTCENEKEEDRFAMEFSRSLTDCMKFHPKQIYIRVIPPAKLETNDSFRIFCDDILEVIPLVMQLQNTPMKGLGAKLEKYRKKWTGKEDVYKTIEMEKFQKILEEFDIDKSLLTIVADPIIIATRDGMINQGGGIRTYSWDMKVVMDISQALRFVFQALVIGVNLKTDNTIKPKILKVLKEIYNLEQGSFVTLDNLKKSINELKTESKFTYYDVGTFNFSLYGRKSDDVERESYYLKAAELFELPVYKNFLEENTDETPDPSMPVWMIRSFIQFGWIHTFFTSNKTNGIRDVMMNVLLFEVPEDKRKGMTEFLENTVKTPPIFTTVFSEPVTSQAPKPTQKASNSTKPTPKRSPMPSESSNGSSPTSSDVPIGEAATGAKSKSTKKSKTNKNDVKASKKGGKTSRTAKKPTPLAGKDAEKAPELPGKIIEDSESITTPENKTEVSLSPSPTEVSHAPKPTTSSESQNDTKETHPEDPEDLKIQLKAKDEEVAQLKSKIHELEDLVKSLQDQNQQLEVKFERQEVTIEELIERMQKKNID